MTDFDDLDYDRTIAKRRSDGSLGHIGQYRLMKKLGAGAFGVVYLARDPNGVEFALKGLLPEYKRDAVQMESLKTSFARIARLEHRNIAGARVLDTVNEAVYFDEATKHELRLLPGDPVMVMSYAPGVTLGDFCRKFPSGVVPVDTAVEICLQVASALDYAHSEDVIHRDIKPGNIMVDEIGGKITSVKVIDFGLALRVHASMSRSLNKASGGFAGTVAYMAPEQWDGTKLSPAADQYALAVVLYELLSGAVPFKSVFESGNEVLMSAAVKSNAPLSIRSITPRQNHVLRKALAKRPEARYATCSEFMAAFIGRQVGGEGLGAAAKAFGLALFDEGVALCLEVRPYLLQLWEWGRRRNWGWQSFLQSFLPARKILPAPENVVDINKTTTAGSLTGVEPAKDYVPAELEHARCEIGGGHFIELVTIPPMSFMMGSPGREIGRRATEKLHRVTLTQPFRMAVAPVTQDQWAVVMGSNPSVSKRGGAFPVENISWEDCAKFVDAMNSRCKVGGWRWALPTDAQWECACRAGTSTPYATAAGVDDVAWYIGNSEGKTHPVMQKQANAFGLYDMLGNVWEWCADGWVDRLPLTPQTDPEEKPGNGKYVCRGGSWNNSAGMCRSASRMGNARTNKFDCLGFRLAMIKV